jgi:protoheme IX farnesyltransferase
MSAWTVGAGALAADNRRLSDFLTLTKPEITFNVLLTALVGFLAGAQGTVHLLPLVHALLGTGLVAAGASTLNQWAERRHDALMRRTIRRPLPAGRLGPRESLAFGVALVALGTTYLALGAGILPSALAGATAASYLLVYTPLKRVTSLATVVGAVPGAMPPLIGWAAARGTLAPGAWVLFLILFFWQMPHFLALAALYRKDYARAGFRVLPVVDPDGASTGRQAVLYALALLVVSLLPAPLGMAGALYFFGALALGVGFVYYGVRLALAPENHAHASSLFRYSLLYLPVLCALMALG